MCQSCNIAAAGCNRGYISKHISPDSVEELIICDVSQKNLDVVPVMEGIKVRKLILDEENIEVSILTKNGNIFVQMCNFTNFCLSALADMLSLEVINHRLTRSSLCYQCQRL